MTIWDPKGRWAFEQQDLQEEVFSGRWKESNGAERFALSTEDE